ncbi:MAG: UxaA family hydrolase, partial [Hyphomicrobiales bacterium]
LKAGQAIEDGSVTLGANVPRGHKIATAAISEGDAIVKYGQIIGFASSGIDAGEHIHTHNCAFSTFERDYAFGKDVIAVDAPGEQFTFEGYRRANGKAGTRNYIAICSSVNCSATVSRYIADAFNRTHALDEFANVDGVVAFSHGTGCGMASEGEGFENLERVLWGMASHANVGAVLMVGLGCEVFQIPRMTEKYGLTETERFHSMTIQGSGGTQKTLDEGIARIKEMLPFVNSVERETIPASELTVALQCGGSDAYSGITANPALGVATDLLVAQGGTGVLAETPEIYGAEHLLTRRAASRQVGEKLVERIKWWEEYTARHGGSMDNNPSPGNKAGGLTTILEKSLGAAAKGGSTPLQGVFRYGEQVDCKGFVFMDTPGYDPASITGQVAGGSNLVCFTTGRGSAYGCKPAPSIKLATNTPMYDRMEDDMDINCGDIADGDVSVEDKGREILDTMLRVASGEKTKSERLGLGDNEFVPWQIGAVM